MPVTVLGTPPLPRRCFALFFGFLHEGIEQGGLCPGVDGLALHAGGELLAGHGLVLHQEIRHLVMTEQDS